MATQFERLPKTVQDRLRPLLPVMQQAEAANGLPPGTLLTLAAEESAGNVSAVGDVGAKGGPAIGLYQVRDRKYWLGGADPADPVAATKALAPRLKNLLDSCNGDPACLHFKYMAGQNAAYTPENVAARSKAFPHVASRLARVGGTAGEATRALSGQARIDAMPAWSDAGAGRGVVNPAYVQPDVPLDAVTTLPTPPKVDPVTAAQDEFYAALIGLSPYDDAAPVKSRKRTNILGL